MPTAGAGGASPAIAGTGMSPDGDFSTEFILHDSDDGQSPFNYNDFVNTSPDTLQTLDHTNHNDFKGFFQTPEPPPANGPGSLGDSYQDSSSESASSKRTGSTGSTKAPLTSGDIMMADVDMKGWKADELFDQDAFFHARGGFPSTIDPSSIGSALEPDGTFENSFGLNTASTASSPETAATTTDTASPQMSMFHSSNFPIKAEPYTGQVGHGHVKAQSQYSLTQDMNDLSTLSTNGSREVSPLSNMVTSHNASPHAIFNNSPSPAGNVDFVNGNPMWLPNGGFTGSPFQPLAHGLPHPAAMAMPQFPFSQQIPPKLSIQPLPLKSRVETQIPIKMTLSPLPIGIKRLHLPTHTISKPKLMAKPAPERSPDMLELYVMLVCTSAMQSEENLKRAMASAGVRSHSPLPEPPSQDGGDDEGSKPQNGGEVRICAGCITRERKRASRKKTKKPEDDILWRKDEEKRVIVFNTQEIKEWQSTGMFADNVHTAIPQAGDISVEAPMRIACYCRHHQEKHGFQVIFTIKDFQDNIVAQQISSSIMITDDHKTPQVPPPPNAAMEAPANAPDSSFVPPPATQGGNKKTLSPPSAPFRLTQSTSDLQSLKRPQPGVAFHSAVSAQAASSVSASQHPSSAAQTPRLLSRPASPTGIGGPSNKKRKSSGSSKVPTTLAMTRIETGNLPTAQLSSGQPNSSMSSATSPFSPSLGSFPLMTEPYGHNPAAAGPVPPPFTTGPPTPNSNDQMFFSNGNRSASMENLSMPLFSAPPSAHPSRAPSPSGMRNSVGALQQAHLAQTQAISGLQVGVNQPVIHKVIPSEGPKSGGIDVTILGGGFYQGLEVMFGDRKATTTTFWGDSSLVCLLPPAVEAGQVRVTLKHQNMQSPPFAISKQRAMFTYVEDDEDKLIRTALTIVGLQMKGEFEDVKEIARRIIGNTNAGWGGGQQPGPAGFNNLGNNLGFGCDVEGTLLKLLEMVDNDDSPRKPRWNMRRTNSGQTMLHLACSLGFSRIVSALLVRGANPDPRDRGGFTPMHLAALNDHPEIVRRLIIAHADPTVRTLSGYTPADMATSPEVLRATRRIERHARSRSGGSLHSRASSATSLRSLWGPEPLSAVSAIHPGVAESSSDESELAKEYEGIDSSDESSGSEDGLTRDGDAFLEMRNIRRSAAPQPKDATASTPLQAPQDPTLHPAHPSPTAAMFAFKDQLAAQYQQLHQTMALHLQNLPQFPQMPTLPNMPPMPDYQEYTAPVMRRMTSLVPNMGATRLDPNGRPSSKDVDGRWWDFSSLIQSSAPPPAYEDIFPHASRDAKQASAAQAAAEAEADAKCATFYDQPSASAEADSRRPTSLTIGRKHAITKEQQENWRHVHAEKFKRLREDRSLFLIWIPLLVVMLCVVTHNLFPGMYPTAWTKITSAAPVPSFIKTVRERLGGQVL